MAFQRVADMGGTDKGDEQRTLTMDEARNIVQGMLTAGVDTTGGNMSWKLLHIAMSPEAQEGIYREQLSLNGNDPSSLQVSTSSVLPRDAPYLNSCLRESHRLASPVLVAAMKRFRATRIETDDATAVPGFNPARMCERPHTISANR